jgi:hypothetical protein
MRNASHLPLGNMSKRPGDQIAYISVAMQIQFYELYMYKKHERQSNPAM